MGPTILVVGATGNTGRAVVHKLLEMLQTSDVKAGSRVLGVTRSTRSEISKQLSQLPNFTLLEKDWTEIDADWLRQHNVTRAFIAPHNQSNQFPEESGFHRALLLAGVKYVVRISTTSANVGPTSPVFYGRQHWAIETLLNDPSFEGLQWTSLQPNVFYVHYLQTAAKWIMDYRKSGIQGILRLMPPADTKNAPIDAEDVGYFAAHLLVLEDPSPHNKAKYILNGPSDVTGREIVHLVEELSGGKVGNVVYKDTSVIDEWLAGAPSKIIDSIKTSTIPIWNEDKSLLSSSTSKEVIAIAGPTSTVERGLRMMSGL